VLTFVLETHVDPTTRHSDFTRFDSALVTLSQMQRYGYAVGFECWLPSGLVRQALVTEP
jgi:hypothetical protein